MSVREPGGTAVGDEIRRMLLDPASDIVPRAEALLFMASRAQLVEREIRPALDARRDRARRPVLSVDLRVSGRRARLPGGRASCGQRAWRRTAWCPTSRCCWRFRRTTGWRARCDRGGHDRMERAELAFHERVCARLQRSRPRVAERAPRVRTDRVVDGRGTERDVFARVLAALMRALAGGIRDDRLTGRRVFRLLGLRLVDDLGAGRHREGEQRLETGAFGSTVVRCTWRVTPLASVTSNSRMSASSSSTQTVALVNGAVTPALGTSMSPCAACPSTSSPARR